MPESNQTPVIKITSPEDVLDVLPTLLGFYPTESLCAVVVNHAGTPEGTRRKVALTIRADMPTTTSAEANLSRGVPRAGRPRPRHWRARRRVHRRPGPQV